MQERNFVEVMRNKDFNPAVGYAQVRPLVQWTYAWMVMGLLVTTGVALFTASNLLESLTPATMLIAFVAQIGVVIALTWAMPRLSPALAAGLFLLYSGLTGFTLSVILLVYTSSAITTAFVATVALFGALTFFAFTTNLDLSRWQNILFVALIGLVIAMFVNMLLGSALIDYVISLVGVVIFTGLTAMDTQKLKRVAAMPEMQQGGAALARMSIFLALELYLDFINLFLFILRLLNGSSRQ